jgi:hypothetical protein
MLSTLSHPEGEFQLAGVNVAQHIFDCSYMSGIYFPKEYNMNYPILVLKIRYPKKFFRRFVKV